ncbi:phage major capsid protein [Bacillus cereus]|uniref:SU10 major capsid protein n=1 Tax=Bacillus cereus group TaxID=86661 RepID=UPI000BF7E947|nr:MULTISPECIES: DUF5309 family protein [Bacillus cereus group]PEY13456.1 phage major capsid protein [Bacillus cereus]PFC28769.1 phage major capsid protein [Bacillus thuringiensis]PHF60753.1 phage major capsid protein [Bacillus wiedmannii]PHF91533.1 phage major capsid protein [Bacillus wiedmannii]
MLDTNKLTNLENNHLTDAIAVVASKATPFMTLLMEKGKVKSTSAKIHSWREKSLDFSDITVAEGVEATNFVNGVRAELSNILEIFLKSTSVSGTAQASGATNDLFAQEINDRLAEVKVAIEKRLINGVKDDASVSGVRKMAGLSQFVDAGNKFQSEGVKALTEKDVRGLARKLFDAGNEDAEIYVLVSPDTKEMIDELYKGHYNYNHVETNFGLVVSSINTNYGTLNFVVDKFVANDKLYAFDINAVSIAFLRQPKFEQLSKTGDNIKGQIVAEATLEVASKKAVAELTIKQA